MLVPFECNKLVPFECNKLLEQSYNGSLPSNEKRAMNMRTNEINSDSSERTYVHLSNGLIQSFEIHYTFKSMNTLRLL